MKTADSGYLTRKLSDASQEVVVKEEDCHGEESLILSRGEIDSYNGNYEASLYGRILASDLQDSNENTILKA